MGQRSTLNAGPTVKPSVTAKPTSKGAASGGTVTGIRHPKVTGSSKAPAPNLMS